MPEYIALLAGINLGNRRIKMGDLKRRFDDMGFEYVQTVLASGNVIFETSLRSSDKVESLIEANLKKGLGYDVSTFIRTQKELADVVSQSPFALPGDKTDGFSIQVQFFKQPLPKKLAAQISKIKTPADRFAAVGRELYWRVTGRMSDSTVWASPEMKALSLPRGTVRNMNTVLKLVNLSDSR